MKWSSLLKKGFFLDTKRLQERIVFNFLEYNLFRLKACTFLKKIQIENKTRQLKVVDIVRRYPNMGLLR
jgi:hypothetical protein